MPALANLRDNGLHRQTINSCSAQVYVELAHSLTSGGTGTSVDKLVNN